MQNFSKASIERLFAAQRKCLQAVIVAIGGITVNQE